jgi:hypothetical protein
MSMTTHLASLLLKLALLTTVGALGCMQPPRHIMAMVFPPKLALLTTVGAIGRLQPPLHITAMGTGMTVLQVDLRIAGQLALLALESMVDVVTG